MLRSTANQSQPWWKFGHVWLIISGPAVVIVAGFFTLYLAISRPDHLVAEDYYQKGVQINQAPKGGAISMAPAVQGRNHAATGVLPGTPPAPTRP